MKYLFSVATFFAGLTLVAGSALAYVSPGKPTGYVNDYTGTLSMQTKSDLENLLKNFQASGTGEISVVIIPTLAGDSIEEYSIQLAREWGIGQKGKDNGALLLIAKDDRELRIEVGYGFEGVLTDAKSSRIINEVITPRFKEGDYNSGVSNGVKEIVGLLNPQVTGGTQTVDYSAPAPTTSGTNDITGFVFFGFMVLMWTGSMLARSKSWWAGGVIGGVFGLIVSLFIGFMFAGLIMTVILILLGLLIDYVISNAYQQSVASGTRPPWWTGGSGRGGGGGSSFGGFGGGGFGGGGASGRW